MLNGYAAATACALAVCFLAARPGFAQEPSPYALCETSIAQAEQAHRIPAKLMPAISRVESGRLDPVTGRVRPWPWTINVEGTGAFFDSKEQAIAAVQGLLAKGPRSIDVGCMQVNLRHHPNAFTDLQNAFDPPANTQYAARFLSLLYRQTGNWNLATAAYHSQDADRGEDYQRRVFGRVMTPMGPGRVAEPTGPYGAWPAPGVVFGALPPASLAFGAFNPAPARAAGAFGTAPRSPARR